MTTPHYVIRGGMEGRERLRVLARVMSPTTEQPTSRQWAAGSMPAAGHRSRPGRGQRRPARGHLRRGPTDQPADPGGDRRRRTGRRPRRPRRARRAGRRPLRPRRRRRDVHEHPPHGASLGFHPTLTTASLLGAADGLLRSDVAVRRFGCFDLARLPDSTFEGERCEIRDDDADDDEWSGTGTRARAEQRRDDDRREWKPEKRDDHCSHTDRNRDR
jgi:hypothetical protein